ncbi:porin family protein [Apibacter sp. HY039]|uniref:porin family protein n=1 Tax=Apibacter sp. HY039 TaxID=2501476 RepID=UPI000FEB823C|nr:porin family protein [Apibacter sp. HY039]
MQISKRLLIAMICLTSLSSHIYSQIRIGVKGNLQFTNVTDVHEFSETRNFAPALGVIAQIPFNDANNNFFFQPEILYSWQGEKNGDVINIEYFQDYVNLPLMLKYYFADFLFSSKKICNCKGTANHEFFLEAGPQLGFLVKQKNKDSDDLYYGGVSKFDFSFGLGAGITFRRKLELSARYNYGLTDAYKNYPRQNSVSNLAFSVSYLFGTSSGAIK